MNLYLTADRIGIETGGGAVTFHESEALKMLGPCRIYDRDVLTSAFGCEPWTWDNEAYHYHKNGMLETVDCKLAHVYAGTFTTTVASLKAKGIHISYTAAAHDIAVSRKEHEALGVPFAYPHLTDPELWKRYVGGYLAADVVVCPSQHSKRCMESYGCKNVVVIPHGCNLPPENTIAPLPKHFVLGYLGAVGPDKGLRYLFEAWRKLNLPDATLLIAGRDSTNPWTVNLATAFAGCSGWVRDGTGRLLSTVGPLVVLAGWVGNVASFYNQISAYCQPSASEGFGIEVLEAMSYGRYVVCSDGVGASDLIGGEATHLGTVVPACNSEALANGISMAQTITTGRRIGTKLLGPESEYGRLAAEAYTWDKIKTRYVELWKGMLA